MRRAEVRRTHDKICRVVRKAVRLNSSSYDELRTRAFSYKAYYVTDFILSIEYNLKVQRNNLDTDLLFSAVEYIL